MVDVAAVEALDHELTRETEVFADLKGLFVYVLAREVLGDAAVVSVAKLDFVVFVVKQVVNVHIVYVTLDVLQVDVISLVVSVFLLALAICAISSLALLSVFFAGGLSVVGFLEPWVHQDLRYCQALVWLQTDHAFDEVLRIL